MTLNDYQDKAQEFDLTTSSVFHMDHAVFGLLEEAGEVAGVFKRYARGDYGTTGDLLKLHERRDAEVKKELGDVLWYVAALAASAGFSLEEIAKANIAKLEDRKARNTIRGNGDER